MTQRLRALAQSGRVRGARVGLAGILGVAALGLASTGRGQEATADTQLAAYAPVLGIAGNLTSVGSDSLLNLMTLWAEGFTQHYPGVRAQVEGKGSSTAVTALIEGTAQLGPMSREMKTREVESFEQRFGYRPTPIRVAIDALAVYVHRDNPIEHLTLPQLDALFSRTRRCGLTTAIDTWAQLEPEDASGARPVRLYGRNSASGTYGFFKDRALCQGDFRDTTTEQPGSASVVQAVSGDRYGIGYSGIGYRTSGVKALALAREAGQPYATTDPEEVYAGRYPLARFLYVYVHRVPGTPLDPLTEQFLRFVLSRDGQEAVRKDGYLPLPRRVVDQELAKLG